MEMEFTINGLIVTDKNFTISGTRRKSLENNWVLSSEIDQFMTMLDEYEEALNNCLSSERRRSVSYLHDIRTSVSTVLSCCESVIGEGKGSTFSEKISNATPKLKSLYQSINLLNEQLDLTDIIINPKAMSYGPMNSSSINSFLYKMVKIFEPRAHSINNHLILKGHTSYNIKAYNSFQFVPLVLLDNAIKYSYRNREIYVNIRDYEDSDMLRIIVSSYGEVVPDAYSELIFNKYQRGPNVEQSHAQGMGLGLYIAREICNLHGFSIHYESNAIESTVGNSDFIITIPKI